ncbi:MAG TPA: hypothetical protein VLW85_05280 [Myxococcales bacterium]|nr:hypothetical protein [Myxococcales bacterium]
MTKSGKSGELAEAALQLDQELRRFEELADQAGRVKLNTEKSLKTATEALQRAAESQDRISAQVQKLNAALLAARQKQEADAAALIARAQQIAARRGEFAQVLDRMAALGQMTKDVQQGLKAGADLGQIEQRMQQVAGDAAALQQAAGEKGIEDVARQAETMRAQVLSAKNKVALLAKKKS